MNTWKSTSLEPGEIFKTPSSLRTVGEIQCRSPVLLKGEFWDFGDGTCKGESSCCHPEECVALDQGGSNTDCRLIVLGEFRGRAQIRWGE